MIRFLSGLHDPIHRLIVKLVVDCLAVIYAKQKYHWLSGENQLLDTNPKWKIRW